jgi:hypothetical protein
MTITDLLVQPLITVTRITYVQPLIIFAFVQTLINLELERLVARSGATF